MARRLTAHPLVPGAAAGTILRSSRPLSFWGGVDPGTGTIIDRRHDRHGETIAGRVLALPAEKGSSTASAVLLELIRTDRAPAAIVTGSVCPVLALGAIIGDALYGRSIPIVIVAPSEIEGLPDGAPATVTADGTVWIEDTGESGRPS